MKAQTRLLFKSLLNRCQIDCLCDIGSCDGFESLLFRVIVPKAEMFAFEANPVLFKKMKANPALTENRIEVLPYAISNKKGTANFHVPDLDYDDENVVNPGMGSLLVHENLKVRDAVEVSTRRIDEFILTTYPNTRNIALWIDAEGAEFDILEGMSGIKDRVAVIHVETALEPMRVGQKVYSEVEALLKGMGFVPVGNGMSDNETWGDVVFANEQVIARLGFKLRLCQWAAWLGYWIRLKSIGGFLLQHCNPLYRFCSRIYVKLIS